MNYLTEKVGAIPFWMLLVGILIVMVIFSWAVSKASEMQAKKQEETPPAA